MPNELIIAIHNVTVLIVKTIDNRLIKRNIEFHIEHVKINDFLLSHLVCLLFHGVSKTVLREGAYYLYSHFLIDNN